MGKIWSTQLKNAPYVNFLLSLRFITLKPSCTILCINNSIYLVATCEKKILDAHCTMIRFVPFLSSLLSIYFFMIFFMNTYIYKVIIFKSFKHQHQEEPFTETHLLFLINIFFHLMCRTSDIKRQNNRPDRTKMIETHHCALHSC